MMTPIRLKNTLCLVLTLSLVGGWPSITTCGAEESEQPSSECILWAAGESPSEAEPPSEETPEAIPSATQEETRQPQNSKTTELLKDVGQVALVIAALPVLAAAYVVAEGIAVVYGTASGTYYCCREVWKRAKERLAPGQNKGDSYEND
jgi:hypothetical protein